MKILVFLHGTLIMHAAGVGVCRAERVRQVAIGHPSVNNYEDYVPIAGAVRKLDAWAGRGAELLYISSHQSESLIAADRKVLASFDFPKGKVHWRKGGITYRELVQQLEFDVLIEDDCESIGGISEMVYPNLNKELQAKVRSVIVKEFSGIDALPDDPFML